MQWKQVPRSIRAVTVGVGEKVVADVRVCRLAQGCEPIWQGTR